MSWTQSVYTTFLGWRIACINHQYYDHWIIHNCTKFNQDPIVYAEIRFYSLNFFSVLHSKRLFSVFYQSSRGESFFQLMLLSLSLEIHRHYDTKTDVMKFIRQLNKLPFSLYEQFVYKLLFDYSVCLSERVEEGIEKIDKLWINEKIEELLKTMENCKVKGWNKDEKR
ncbi:MAG: hypothetical protein ACKPEN_23545 [Planktothrix sp.]|uniref:hypothetical protein n=1 Tax=Planktothrix sp. TaxID=3088171 RepID=UPI0038D4892F